MLRLFCLTAFGLFFIPFSSAQVIDSFDVKLNPKANSIYFPAEITLPEVPNDASLILFQIINNKKTDVPFQPCKNNKVLLIAEPSGNTSSLHYEFAIGNKPAFQTVDIIDTNMGLTITSGGKNLLRYQYGYMYPPAGIDTAYKKSGFIHPLWSLHGEVLTQIQPPDHYHHYGLWNPWTHVLFEGDTVDFWNLNDRKGTVRFAGLESTESGPVFSRIKTKHEHVVFKKDGTEKTVLNERQQITVYKPDEKNNYYLADIDVEIFCASGSPVLLLEYRYGGLGWRATEKWNRTNSKILTSEGKARKDADGSRAKWIIAEGAIDSAYAGMVILSHPGNYNHPEPLRVWPEDQNGRGDVFINFSPTKNKDWLLEPGKTYNLKYRLIIFDGSFTSEKAEEAWLDFKDF